MSGMPVADADLQGLVDGRLLPEREAEVLAWLRAHPEEAARVAEYRAQGEALRRALAPIADEVVPPALDLRLRAARPPYRAAQPSAAIAAGAIGLLLLGGAGGWELKDHVAPPRTGLAALTREAVYNYAVYANDPARPVELAGTQKAELDSWLSKRLERPIYAPDLRAAGLSLVGGRLVATEHGAAALYFYHDRDGRRIGLYMRPMEVDGTDKMQPRREHDVAGWTWADDGLGIGIFGDARYADLHGVANAARAQLKRI